MNSRKALKTQGFTLSPPIRPSQIRWCPRCRRYRGPDGRFLGRQVVRQVFNEAERTRSEIRIRDAFGPGITEARARQAAAILFDAPRPVAPPPPTGRAIRAAQMSALLFDTPMPMARPPATEAETRAARMSALLFDTPMPTTPRRLSPAEARAARTARLLFG